MLKEHADKESVLEFVRMREKDWYKKETNN
jgi:hypothetical protein